MTILNAWIEPGVATIASDTTAAVHDGSARQMSKFNLLPHINAGIGVRGNSHFAAAVLAFCRDFGFESFDEMLDGLPNALRAAEGFGHHLQAQAGERGYEALAVGWSDRRVRMLGRLFRKREGDEAIGIQDVDDTSLISPWDSSMEGTSTELANVEQLVAVQARWLAQFGASGGHLVLCRLTKDAALVTRACLPTLERAPDLGKATDR